MDEALVYPFRGLIDALYAKDPKLYLDLCHLSPSQFWREWKAIHPEDFPEGDMSLPIASSVKQRRMTLSEWDAARARFDSSRSP